MADKNMDRLMNQAKKEQARAAANAPKGRDGDRDSRQDRRGAPHHGGTGFDRGGSRGGGFGGAPSQPQRQDEGPTQHHFVPMPSVLTGHRDSIANFGLLFQKYAAYDGTDLKHQRTAEDLFKNSAKVLPKAKEELQRLHRSHDAFLRALSGHKLQATLIAPLATGIGNAHAGEVGMTFDRNIGVPFIPSSSIKGVVRRAYCLELYEQAERNGDTASIAVTSWYDKKSKKNIEGPGIMDDEPGLVHLFGHPEPARKDASRGQIVFLDAFPENIPTMHLDIMNPHHSKYYQGGPEGPVETESPVPIKFLTVNAGTQFVFRWFIKNLRGSRAVQPGEIALLEKAWSRALSEFGLGAKTSIGYGRFSVVSN